MRKLIKNDSVWKWIYLSCCLYACFQTDTYMKSVRILCKTKLRHCFGSCIYVRSICKHLCVFAESESEQNRFFDSWFFDFFFVFLFRILDLAAQISRKKLCNPKNLNMLGYMLEFYWVTASRRDYLAEIFAMGVLTCLKNRTEQDNTPEWGGHTRMVSLQR